MDQESVDIKTGRYTDLDTGEIQRRWIIDQGVDRIQASIVHLETGRGAHVLDHQTFSLRENEQGLVSGRDVHIPVRCGRQRCRQWTARDTTTAQGACLRVDQPRLRTGHIEGGTDAATTLHEQRVHLETGRHTELDDAEIERVRVVDQGVDRVLAHIWKRKIGRRGGVDDHQSRALCQHVDQLVPSWHIRSGDHLRRYSGRSSFIADDRFVDHDRAGGHIAGSAHQNGVILHFTNAVVCTGALIVEGAHVHAHSLRTGSGSGRNAHRAGLLTKARGLEHEFGTTEGSIVVPIHPGTPTVTQEEGTARVHSDPIGCSEVHIGHLRGEVAVAVVIAAHIVNSVELDTGNIERIT